MSGAPPETPTGRLRAWLREALGVVRDAVAEAPLDPGPRPLGGQAPTELHEAFGARALVGDGGLIADWAPARAALDAAVDGFAAGAPTAIAIVGAAGSGREVLLDHVERRARRAGSWPCARVSAGQGGLEQALAAARVDAPRQALLVRDAHRAYRRQIGGFRELRRSLDLLTDTLGDTLWAVEFDRVPWSYLDHVYQVAARFTHVIEVPPLGVEDLHLALQRRLVALAGQARFEFPVPDDLPLEEHTAWARTGFPARLHAACRGNPEAAGELVLAGLTPAGAPGAYRVAPPPGLSLGDLAGLPPQSVVALELLLGHETLTPPELGELLALAPGEARALLEALSTRGLVRGDRRVGYRVDPGWRAPIVDHLQSKNLL